MKLSFLISAMREQITIEKIIAGGAGLGRFPDGRVVLAHGVLPTETVLVEENCRRKGVAEARVLELLAASPERVAPCCRHYGVCGGCDLMHASYAEQTRIKAAIVEECARRTGLAAEGQQGPLLPAPRPLGYRHRLRFRLDPQGRPGFSRFRGNQVVAVEHCPVAAPELNVVLARLGAALAGQGRGEFELVVDPEERRVALVAMPPRGEKAGRLGRRLATLDWGALGVATVLVMDGQGARRIFPDKEVSCLLRWRLDLPCPAAPMELRWPPGSFSQVNLEQNQALVALVLGLAGEVAGRAALDLFCGMGNFSLALARLGARVHGIEQSPASIRAARENARLNRLASCEFQATEVAAGLARLIAADQRFDLVILDPPRRGAREIMDLLPELGPRRIVYVSCDPPTLMRDLALLTARGLRFSALIPVDMFPQTHHIETVAVLDAA